MTEEDQQKNELVPYKMKAHTKIHHQGPKYNKVNLQNKEESIVSLDKVNINNSVAGQLVQDIFQHAAILGVG